VPERSLMIALSSPSTQRNLVLLLLLAVAAAGWAWLLVQAGSVAMAMSSPTMALPAPAFLAMWIIMMVAMMFPTMAPMVLTFHHIQSGKRTRGKAFVSTWLFVAGYMVVWAAAGIAAYLGAVTAEAISARSGLSAAAAVRIGGGLLIATGLYQLTPLKNVCLSKCRSPIGFLMTSWRDGGWGALRMGLDHGSSCLGCCWLLMAILFPLGIMNIAAMALVMLVVFAEKALPWERLAVYSTAAALLAYGVVVLAVPQILPTFVASGTGTAMPGMAMPASPAPPMQMPTAEPADRR
jgi:predicted metal-binding membrane protein